jgi:hypothetical protein
MFAPGSVQRAPCFSRSKDLFALLSVKLEPIGAYSVTKADAWIYNPFFLFRKVMSQIWNFSIDSRYNADVHCCGKVAGWGSGTISIGRILIRAGQRTCRPESGLVYPASARTVLCLSGTVWGRGRASLPRCDEGTHPVPAVRSPGRHPFCEARSRRKVPQRVFRAVRGRGVVATEATGPGQSSGDHEHRRCVGDVSMSGDMSTDTGVRRIAA